MKPNQQQKYCREILNNICFLAVRDCTEMRSLFISFLSLYSKNTFSSENRE